MTLQTAKNHLQQFGIEDRILLFEESSATVELAAAVLGVEPGRIAKTLSFKSGEEAAIVLVTAGDTKIDNGKFKKQFGLKPRMLPVEEVVVQTGHEIGGVCPFGLNAALTVYVDVSLKRFETVFPACGSSNSAIELNCEELTKYIGNPVVWVDVCKGWQKEEETACTN